MKLLAEAKKWRPVSHRDIRPFRVPKVDFDKFLAVPSLPDSARDKITADSGGRSSLRSPFKDKERNTLEDTLVKVDTASRAGLRIAFFLQLLSEYLVASCEVDSPVSPEATELAFRCLDHCLRICMDQFIRISLLSTKARRSNVLESIFLPSEGAKSRLEALSLLGADLFGGKFQEAMEAEAKRIEATDKINLRKSPQTSSTSTFKGKRGSGPHRPATESHKPFRQGGRAGSDPAAPSTSRQPPQSGTFNTYRRGRGAGASFTPRPKTSYGGRRGGVWRK